MSRVLGAAAAVAVLSLVASRASAKPVAPAAFCGAYPDAPACASGAVECTTCHTVPPAFNEYGRSVAGALLAGEPRPLDDARFAGGLPAALAAVEGLDADGDGASNRDEIAAGTAPADAASKPAPATAGCQGEGAAARAAAAGYDVCRYDARYAFRKVSIDFCGRSPTREELASFDAAPAEASASVGALLDSCLRGAYWRGQDGAVWNLANKKIRPLQTIKAGEGAGPIPLADYFDDYAFFVYTQIDDHDARDLLVGQYFVDRVPGDVTGYAVRPQGRPGNERVPAERRAGMLTHRWFLVVNTMFTAVPRTTAAQAYRAYLGLDIAKQEGLFPVSGEPVDFDAKGVQAAECAACHSTLDPLAYPFSRYEGLGGGAQGFANAYRPDRMARFAETDGPAVVDTPEDGMLFGEPVADLLAWARTAADSDAFARALVLDYWKLLLGEPPRPDEAAEFAELWGRFKTVHAYSVERMLRDLVATEAYGVP
jgi:hypothetical protein